MSAESPATLARRLGAELAGTAFLLAAIAGAATAGRTGSGTAGPFAISIALCAGIIAITMAFARMCPGHFNPALTLASAFRRELGWRDAALYVAAQVLGALLGVGVASFLHAELTMPVSSAASLQVRRVELVTAFGLVAVALACRHSSLLARASSIGAYSVAAVWATGTTCFGNPAVVLAAAAVAPGLWPAADLAAALASQLAGAMGAALVMAWMSAESGVGETAAGIVALPAARHEERPEIPVPRLVVGGE